MEQVDVQCAPADVFQKTACKMPLIEIFLLIEEK